MPAGGKPAPEDGPAQEPGWGQANPRAGHLLSQNPRVLLAHTGHQQAAAEGAGRGSCEGMAPSLEAPESRRPEP